MALPCSNEQVKKAFVFSCFTGLRLSDARTLTWRKVYKTPDGKTLYIHVFMQKTQKPNNIPLSQEALNCLQAKDDLDEPIFTLPASDATINYHVKKLVKAAGIEKKVSFHCSRHTFATTVYLCNGGTIEALSKILGHKHISTTQIYAEVTNRMVSSDFRAISGNLAAMQRSVLEKKDRKQDGKRVRRSLRETA